MSIKSKFSWKLKQRQSRRKLNVYRWVEDETNIYFRHQKAKDEESEDEFLQFYRQYRHKDALPEDWIYQQERLIKNLSYTKSQDAASPCSYASVDTQSRDSGRSSGGSMTCSPHDPYYRSQQQQLQPRCHLWAPQGCKPPWFDPQHLFNKQIDEDSQFDSDWYTFLKAKFLFMFKIDCLTLIAFPKLPKRRTAGSVALH